MDEATLPDEVTAADQTPLPANPVDGLNVRVETLRYRDLLRLEVNARFMTHETYKRLVRNIKRDGVPTQIPFCWWNDERGGWEILSGNHRADATNEALGDDYVGPVIVTNDKLSADRRLAIQLSHNSITGEDDPAILKQLYEQIGEVDLKEYSGLDDKTLDLLEQVTIEGLSEANLEFTTVTLTFLPEEADEAKITFAQAREQVSGEMWLTSMADYDRTLDALANAADAHGVSNQAVALHLLLELAEAHVTELSAGWWDERHQEVRHTGWVPIATVIGTDRVPAEVAAVLKQAVAKLSEAGDIKHPWQVIEAAAAEILAG